MSKPQKRQAALKLRRNGESISSISKVLSVSKSTASVWCKDIVLTEQQQKRLVEKSNHRATSALLRAAMAKRSLKNVAIKNAIHLGKSDVGSLTLRDVFMVGLGLYWGEGYKKGSQELGFTNSDPEMIRFYLVWLNRVYFVKNQDLILRVSINSQHKHREKDILHYWSSVTKIPSSQFTKTSFIKTHSRKKYDNFDVHFGTLRIKVRKGTNLRRRILGSISSLNSK